MTLTGRAQTELGRAADAARGTRRLPDPTEVKFGIPEQNGPDSPDNPWFVRKPQPTAPPTGLSQAATHAIAAVELLDQTLALGDQISDRVRTALTNGRREAQTGVGIIRRGIVAPHGEHLPMRFDAAGLWVDMARSFIQLELGVKDPTRVPHAVVPDIQLPAPDAPIQ